MNRHIAHQIQAGDLELSLNEGGERLEELMTFASRLNPKRGYLFVSRVLGKHIPVRPSVMDGIHAELAERISLYGSTAYVVGMAETAVGLGAGVARHLAASCSNCVFHHTTRFLVPNPWVRIREAHSHADTMHMAALNDGPRHIVSEAEDLVLVDDEVTTGRTLAQLAESLLAQPELAMVKRLHIVSIASWLAPADREALLNRIPDTIQDVRFVQLMAGQFRFTPSPDYQAQLPMEVDTAFCPVLLDRETGAPRVPIESEGLYGVVATSAAAEHALIPTAQPVAIFGMGEFLDLPFRLALSLEQRGADVLFQSSTRSPIALGDCIESWLEHPAPGAPEKRHFLYNPSMVRSPLAFDGIGRLDLAEALENSCNHRQAEFNLLRQVAV
tara:strand:+ start:14218 stop:15375 length:1158 start_codon:yes stop_codon:yes gene_type:complete